jgi:outer membrane protein
MEQIMQRTSRVILLIILAAGISFGQKSLTLNEAISIALHRNTTLQTSDNNLKTAQKTAETAYGTLLPTVSASGGWSWSHETSNGGQVSINSILVNTNNNTTDSRQFDASLASNWTLYDGLSNYSVINQNKNSFESAKLAFEKLKQDIIFQTISYYYDLLDNEELLKVKEDDLKWNQKNLETVNARNSLGAVTMADVYSQQVKVGNAELALITAKNTYETSKNNILYYLGLDVLENYDFKNPVADKKAENENIAKDYSDISDLVAKALIARADYKSKKIDLQNSYESIKQAKSGYLPTLTNNMSYGVRGNSLSTMFDSRTFSVGLSLNVPIFSGWSVENKVEAAQVASLNKEIEVSDLERTIKLNLQKNYLDLIAAEKQLDVCKKNIVSAEESRKINEEKYSLGSGILLDVMQSNTDFTTAQTNLVNAQFSYEKLKYQIKYLIGVLDSKSFE